MKDWLEKFALSQQAPKMKKMASQVIVNKTDLVDACDGDIVSYDNAKYKVVDCNYCDDKGEGVVLEKCASLVGDPMEVAMGTSIDYATNNDVKEQEYARTEPIIENIDPDKADVDKFTDAANATEDAIAQENAIDGTTGYTYPNRILQRIIDKYTAVPDATVDESKDSTTDNTIVDEYTDIDFDVEPEEIEQIDEPTMFGEEVEPTIESTEDELFTVPDTTLVATDMRSRKIARR